MPDFNALFDRHLALSKRVAQAQPEQAYAQIEQLISDIETSIEAGELLGVAARQMAAISAHWSRYLAAPPTNAKSLDIESLPVRTIIAGLSTKQAWAVGSAIVVLLGGVGFIARYEGKLESKTELAELRAELASSKTRANVAAAELEAVNKRVASLTQDIGRVSQERLLLAYALRLQSKLPSRELSRLRNDARRLLDEMERSGHVNAWRDQQDGGTRVEIVRTGEVWFLALE